MRYLWTLLGILLVIGTLAAVKATQIGKLISRGKAAEQAGPPPETVAVARAEEQAWETTLDAVGSVASERGVTLSNESPGVVTRIQFESGAAVKKGQSLLELDTNVEHAQLASAMARKALAQTTFRRTRALAEKGAVSPAELDADAAAFRTASKEADSIQAQIDKKLDQPHRLSAGCSASASRRASAGRCRASRTRRAGCRRRQPAVQRLQ